MIAYNKNSAAFTLLELLIAMAIFATIAIISYAGLHSMLTTAAAVEDDADRLKEIQTAVSHLQRDLLHSINRPIRGEYGQIIKALISNDRGDIKLEFTRGGYRNPASFARSSMQRVAYGINTDDELVKFTWRVLDRAQDSKAIKYSLLTEVDEFSLRFLDVNDEWQTSWPASNNNNSNSKLPKAIEFTLNLKDWGRIKRLIKLTNG